MTPEGIEPPIFGSGIRRVTIAPWSQLDTHAARKKSGGAGYRSLCLMHAKHALYHLSYTPNYSPSREVVPKQVEKHS